MDKLHQEKEPPMGVTQWRNLGKKWGYWDFWLKQEKEKLAEERKSEPKLVKEDKRFQYYQCCGQIIGIGKKPVEGLHIGEILCGKCGRRIY